MVRNLLRATRRGNFHLQHSYEFFGILKDILGLQKAAYLLKSPFENSFRPWVSLGFDETSVHRLRPNASELNLIAGDKDIVSGTPRDLGMASFLSAADFGTIDRVLIVLVRVKSSVEAVLIVADNPYADAGERDQELVFRTIEDILRSHIEQRNTVLKLENRNVPIQLRDLGRDSELRARLLDGIDDYFVVAFDTAKLRSLLQREHEILVGEFAVLDLVQRILHLSRRYLRYSFMGPETLYLCIDVEMLPESESFIGMIANDLSLSITGNTDEESSIRAQIHSIGKDEFAKDIIKLSFE